MLSFYMHYCYYLHTFSFLNLPLVLLPWTPLSQYLNISQCLFNFPICLCSYFYPAYQLLISVHKVWEQFLHFSSEAFPFFNLDSKT